jgi:hypothetical protein
LKETGRKFAWPVHISPFFWARERLLPGKTDKWGKQVFRRKAKARKTCPRPAKFCEQPLRGLPAKPFSLRFFKSDRLLDDFPPCDVRQRTDIV